MSNIEEIKDPVAPVLRKLEPGESATFPIDRWNTVRQMCSKLGLGTDRVYSASQDTVAGTITATREK